MATRTFPRLFPGHRLNKKIAEQFRDPQDFRIVISR